MGEAPSLNPRSGDGCCEVLVAPTRDDAEAQCRAIVSACPSPPEHTRAVATRGYYEGYICMHYVGGGSASLCAENLPGSVYCP